MKTIYTIVGVLLPCSALAFCPVPSYTGNRYYDQAAQQAFNNCLQQEQYQQQQLQMQQQQLQMQQQQLDMQRQQMQTQQYQNGGNINWNLMKPLRP